jgi:hypothetical protein
MLVIGFVALAGLAMLSYLLLNQARLLNDHAPVQSGAHSSLLRSRSSRWRGCALGTSAASNWKRT